VLRVQSKNETVEKNIPNLQKSKLIMVNLSPKPIKPTAAKPSLNSNLKVEKVISSRLVDAQTNTSFAFSAEPRHVTAATGCRNLKEIDEVDIDEDEDNNVDENNVAAITAGAHQASLLEEQDEDKNNENMNESIIELNEEAATHRSSNAVVAIASSGANKSLMRNNLLTPVSTHSDVEHTSSGKEAAATGSTENSLAKKQRAKKSEMKEILAAKPVTGFSNIKNLESVLKNKEKQIRSEIVNVANEQRTEELAAAAGNDGLLKSKRNQSQNQESSAKSANKQASDDNSQRFSTPNVDLPLSNAAPPVTAVNAVTASSSSKNNLLEYTGGLLRTPYLNNGELEEEEENNEAIVVTSGKLNPISEADENLELVKDEKEQSNNMNKEVFYDGNKKWTAYINLITNEEK
jgi:hypothetical protein